MIIELYAKTEIDSFTLNVHQEQEQIIIKELFHKMHETMWAEIKAIPESFKGFVLKNHNVYHDTMHFKTNMVVMSYDDYQELKASKQIVEHYEKWQNPTFKTAANKNADILEELIEDNPSLTNGQINSLFKASQILRVLGEQQ